ncbi:ATP-binding protein [Granulosicoccus antarcticus]|uniref:histidine kinase n=1 Tax=Granulosicoccus antarcticus IMCC3135 TaxID=1192854 RepID=A0A2Z2NWR9_9GAMM|nr:ATP-binding protein [Granulosicoccus antarcticus]ASJ75683.1 Phytochrome-like protein cph1 [Granulosicoccus antarcticus IMCC3135]
MDAKQSLDTFFHLPEPATLDNCDREKIHQSGAIQNIGALLVIDPESHCIIGASPNVAAILGIEPAQLSSAKLEEVDATLAAQISEVVDGTHILHEAIDFQPEHAGVVYDTVTHCHAGRRLIEFVPNSSNSINSCRRNMRCCSKACTTILHTDNFEEAMQMAVDAVRQITGFARVKIYRFLPDWSGEVTAESNDGQVPSYLGLHFPERDIPQQVRHLMTLVPYRGIGTISNDNIPVQTSTQESQKELELDLTWSLLRSVSPMHTQYLSNMGVASTFSTSLMHQGSLWGLIACHNTSPGIVPFDNWGLLHEIGTALMVNHAQKQYSEVARMSHRLRAIESNFTSALQHEGRAETIIEVLAPSLQGFLKADGFAFLFGSHIHVSGKTPPTDFIHELLEWAGNSPEKMNQFHSEKLHEEWPAAALHEETACGVLVQSTSMHRVCKLVWFRGRITQNVHWAGQPNSKKPSPHAKASVLTPRVSFDQWVDEHTRQSAIWQECELIMAKEILRDFMDIITSQTLLSQENQSLRQFAASAAHDLKTPLRGINAALDIMDEENFDESVVKQTHAIAKKSARRLSDLISGLMEFSMTSEQAHEFHSTDLATTVSDALELLALSIKESAAEITVSEMPVIHANEILMLRLFLNLISNAIKYKHPDRCPVIHINSQTAENGCTVITVTDNGQGIEAQYAARIFLPLERLHSHSSVEGSGLGLAICQRVAQVHSGTIKLDTHYQEGSRFIFSIPAHG